MNNESVKGLRSNCIFHDEFVWGKEGDFDELDEVANKSNKVNQPKEEKMIKIEKSEIEGLWEIGQYYIWLTMEGQIGNFSFYTSPEEAKKDSDEYDEMMVKQFADYWSTRCPQ